MKSKKVYCKNCKWFGYEDKNCLVGNFIYNYYSGITYSCKSNKNFDCKFYKKNKLYVLFYRPFIPIIKLINTRIIWFKENFGIYFIEKGIKIKFLIYRYIIRIDIINCKEESFEEQDEDFDI